MSDLISRSELLKAMDTWDKFGYDEHNSLIKIDRTNEEYAPYVHYEDMVKCVNDMPTAYSVDVVVEELSDDVCEWRLCDEEANVYDTSCRNPHILIEGTPIDNNYEYCPYCGKKIKAVEQMDEEDFCYCHSDGTDKYHDCLDYMECEECPYYYADLDQEVE